MKSQSFPPNDDKHCYLDYHTNFEFYFDAISKCPSAGIIPYTFYNGLLYFLFQRILNPTRKKDYGWNDFGGKKIDNNETTAETAAREFSEETSCLFYFKSMDDYASEQSYNLLKDNESLYYDEETIQLLKDTLPLAQKYFSDKITEFASPIYIKFERNIY